MMTLEWIRRRVPVVDVQARKYLFTEKPITDVEDGEAEDAAPDRTAPASRSLGIGSLRHVSVPGLD
jgi:hypothetical protein